VRAKKKTAKRARAPACIVAPAEKSKAEVAREIQDRLRGISQRAAGMNRLEFIAAEIESAVPKNSDDSDARLVHRYLGLARSALAKGKTFEAAIDAGAWIHDATAHWKDLMLWNDAVRGERFSGNKRGLSRLYREAVQVLEEVGAKTPTKLVRKALEARGVIRDNGRVLRWKNDRGQSKSTPVQQFAKHLSKKRTLIR
jgi:hypothetical protein